MSPCSKVTAILGLTAGLLLGGVTGQALSQPKQPHPYAQQIQELHATKALLEQANRDYAGHRAAAVKEIGAAIHALGQGKHHHPAKTTKGSKEVQEFSDLQLKEAIKQLHVVEKELQKSKDEHVVKAMAAIKVAIKELHKALEIR